MATTIATLTQKTDGILEGVFATIRVNAPIAIIPNASKSSEEAPITASSTARPASRSERVGTASPARPARNTSR